jgi:uncharacterized protein (TIGR02996 family)
MDADDEREAHLRAIFDAPQDDLPRLVFADWLEEHREPEWAELIRLQCQQQTAPHAFEREQELLGRVFPQALANETAIFERGFRLDREVRIAADQLGEPSTLRELALRRHPEWYGASELKIADGLILSGKPIQTLLTSPVFEKIARLDLSGSVLTLGDSDSQPEFKFVYDYEYRPVVTVQAVEALVNAREARRLTHLDLRNNDLDNDAARAIVHSTNLIRLKSLQMFDGNQLRGRTWQQLLERFGPDVVQ